MGDGIKEILVECENVINLIDSSIHGVIGGAAAYVENFPLASEMQKSEARRLRHEISAEWPVFRERGLYGITEYILMADDRFHLDRAATRIEGLDFTEQRRQTLWWREDFHRHAWESPNQVAYVARRDGVPIQWDTLEDSLVRVGNILRRMHGEHTEALRFPIEHLLPLLWGMRGMVVSGINLTLKPTPGAVLLFMWQIGTFIWRELTPVVEKMEVERQNFERQRIAGAMDLADEARTVSDSSWPEVPGITGAGWG